MANDTDQKLPTPEGNARAVVSKLLKEHIGHNGELDIANFSKALLEKANSPNLATNKANLKLYFDAADELIFKPRSEWSGQSFNDRWRLFLEPYDRFNFIDGKKLDEAPSNYGLKCEVFKSDTRPPSITTVTHCQITAPEVPKNPDNKPSPAMPGRP